MSRVANNPIELPSGVEAKLNGGEMSVKGGNGNLSLQIHESVDVKLENNVLTFAARNNSKVSKAMSGTMRALVNNMVTGVSKGFEKKSCSLLVWVIVRKQLARTLISL